MGEKRDFAIEELSNNLNERVKELECLYAIAQISEKFRGDTSVCLAKIVEQIPTGFQFPEITQAYLAIDDISFGESVQSTSSIHVSLKLSDGREGNLLVGYSVDNQSGEELTFLLEEEALLRQIAHEITQILEFEINEKNAIQLREKLRFNDRLNALSEITGGIAHELNTPLNNILGYGELLLKGENDAQRRSDLNRVLKSAAHAREIVKKLMFFSCDLPENYALNDINTVVKDSLDMLRIQLHDRAIRLRLNLDPTIPKLRLDVFQFTQVIFNIVRNAIQAMQKNGELTISTDFRNNEIRLSIQDNGCGMDELEISNLYKPFVSGRKGKSNMGIGLSVTQGIVQAHGGRLEVESKPNLGSTFAIIFPVN